jgi:hypothetical protein
MFSTVHPTKTPATAAFTAMAIQIRPSGSGLPARRRALSAVANTKPANNTPPAACQRQCGWFDTGSPQTNFCCRGGSVISPQ